MAEARGRKLTILAQDPSVKDERGDPATAEVTVPLEDLEDGPRGHRVCVIDFDATRGLLLEPARWRNGAGNGGNGTAPRIDYARDSKLPLEDPRFHAQNVYAIAMRTLAAFEFALGRRVPWGFRGHHLYIAPHAMQDANAYYAERDHALLFGYFRGRKGDTVFTCLSHDVVAHEACHAILDGLRDHYTDPSLPDQAAFHEGFADIVALLSVFSLRDLMSALFARRDGAEPSAEWLKDSILAGLAEQVGAELGPGGPRADALRRSMRRRSPDPTALNQADYQEPHRRGEVLVAAVMEAFAGVWEERVQQRLRRRLGAVVQPERLADDAARAAGHLLTICIRALDYCPPVDITFGDYLSALLTADAELVPDDQPYGYRRRLRKAFEAWGITPASDTPEGTWRKPNSKLRYDDIHLEALQRDPEEVYRFLWQNRKRLRIHREAYTMVNWVRPVVRVGPDGFVLRETVVEFVQTLDVEARHLRRLGIGRPEGMPDDVVIRLTGGSTLVFDDFGRLKYEVHKGFENEQRQAEKVAAWWGSGQYDAGDHLGLPRRDARSDAFAEMHRLRMAELRRSRGKEVAA